MKNVILLALTVSLLAATPGNAQTIDFRNIKCAEVLALPGATLVLIAVWLDGFQADDDDGDSMLVDLNDTDADEIRAYCQQYPSAGLLQAVEAINE